MADDLTLSYEGEIIKDWGQLLQKMHSKETRVMVLLANAPPKIGISDLSATHNAGRGLSISTPNRILPGQSGAIAITISGNELWEMDIDKIKIDLSYVLVREY